MKYKIEYSYRTGDSFSSNDATGILELEWNDLNVAKANLKRIQEHYKMYDALNSYFDKRTKQEIIKSFEGNDWLVSDKKLAAFKNETEWWCIDKNQIPACKKQGYKIGEVYDETMAENCMNQYPNWWRDRKETKFDNMNNSKIFVANTFTQEWEMEEYFKLAEQYGYQVVSLIVENRHGNKNIHSVPDETLFKMKERFQIQL